MKFLNCTLFLFFLAMSAATFGQEFSGDWKGSVVIPQGPTLELIFHIKKEAATYQITVDMPAQSALAIPVGPTEVVGNKINVEMKPLQMKFSGTINEANNAIDGFISNGTKQLPFPLTRFEQKLPGDLSLPSRPEQLAEIQARDKGNYTYRVEDYFSKPKASFFQISPNGKYMSYMEKEEVGTKRHVFVKELATGKVRRVVEEKQELIRGYAWINDERLLYPMDKGGDENYHIYGVNVDGSNVKDLTPFDGVQASILEMLKEQKDYIIISMNKNNPQVFEPYKLNVNTGELTQLYTNDDPANPIQSYYFDKDGVLRAFSKLRNGVENQLYYKDLSTGKFELIQTTNWDDAFSILNFNYASKNKDEAYVLTNLESDKSKIVLYDFKKKTTLKTVYENATFDVGGMSRSRKRNYEIDYFLFNGEKPETVPVSAFYKKFKTLAQKQFPGKSVSIVDFDDNETKFLVMVSSDKLYGTYYEFDQKTQAFKLLYDLMPKLKEQDMAEMRPIQFTSRDGNTIYGYITLPKAALQGKKVPMIVNPHGGPQGIRDVWGFNPEVQLFASRGYATLQVNFRISGGYGKRFLRLGFKQIGRALMDDVEDGVKYAIQQGWIDDKKIAIYGASHGGYATLMGLIKTPNLYACGVDYVGVSNVFTLFESFPEYWKPYKEIVKKIWYDLGNPEEAKIAKEVSPVFQADKITKPLLVVQGANDPRVKISESDQIVKALRAKGVDVPYLVKYNEGHGFSREENQIEFYKLMLGFLNPYLHTATP